MRFKLFDSLSFTHTRARAHSEGLSEIYMITLLYINQKNIFLIYTLCVNEIRKIRSLVYTLCMLIRYASLNNEYYVLLNIYRVVTYYTFDRSRFIKIIIVIVESLYSVCYFVQLQRVTFNPALRDIPF